MRVWFNGRMVPSQGTDGSSILLTRSIIKLFSFFLKFFAAAQSAAQCVLRGKSFPLGGLLAASRFSKIEVNLYFLRRLEIQTAVCISCAILENGVVVCDFDKKNFCFFFRYDIMKSHTTSQRVF